MELQLRSDSLFLFLHCQLYITSMETLIAQLKTAEGITEALKATDPMDRTQRMNNIAARAEEIIREELIYL